MKKLSDACWCPGHQLEELGRKKVLVHCHHTSIPSTFPVQTRSDMGQTSIPKNSVVKPNLSDSTLRSLLGAWEVMSTHHQ